MPAHAEAPAAPAAPALRALGVHALCVAACAAAALAVPPALPLAAWACLEGAAAALLGRAAGLPRWWLPINALFCPLLAVLLAAPVDPLVYLGALVVLAACNAGAPGDRVPLFLTTRRAAAALSVLLPRGRPWRLLDLGCGTGSLLEALAEARPDGCFEGIEKAPLPLLLARWRARRRPNLAVAYGDLWHAELARYDVVYAYLSPAPMARLWAKARAEMRPGSLFISNAFAVPGVAPAQTVHVGDRMRTTLFVWRM